MNMKLFSLCVRKTWSGKTHGVLDWKICVEVRGGRCFLITQEWGWNKNSRTENNKIGKGKRRKKERVEEEMKQ